ncbi:hypothetical protein CBS101457_005181 [Exobasidium rhododendri]|nr:hypothetical protein CBS101457_005181 [Exobasidium rhododendri]
MSVASASTPAAIGSLGDAPALSSAAMSAALGTPDAIHPADWTSVQVIRWLGVLVPASISKLYANNFRENDIVGEALIQLDPEALKDIGVSSVGHRLVILKAIYELKMKWGVELEADDWRPTAQDGLHRNGSIAASSSTGTLMAGASRYSMASISSFGIMRALQERDERVRALELELARLEDWLVRWTGEMGNPSKVDPLRPYFPPSKVYSAMPDGSIPGEEYERRASMSNSNHPLSMADRRPSSQYSGPLTAISSAGIDNLPEAPYVFHPARKGSIPGPMTPSSTFDTSHTYSHHPASGKVSQMELSPTSSSATPSATPTSAHPPISAAPSILADNIALHRVASPSLSTPSGAKSASTTIQAAFATSAQPAPNTFLQSASSAGPSSPLLGGSTATTSAATPTTLTKKDERPGGGGGAETPYKSFRVTLDDPCHKVLPAALKKYKINDDWKLYALFICYGTTERCLSYDEKPLLLFQKLKEAKQSPVFMLRHIRDVKSPIAIANAKAAARKTGAVAGKSETGKLKASTSANSISGEQGSIGRGVDAVVKLVGGSGGDKKGEEKYVDSPPGQPRLTGPITQPNDGKTVTTEPGSFAIAIYPYVSEREDEFDVKVGSTFIVKGKAKGWWIVHRDAKATGQADVTGIVKNADGSAKNGGEIRTGWVPAGCLLETKKPISLLSPGFAATAALTSPKTPNEGTFSSQQQRAPSSPGLVGEDDFNTPKPSVSAAGGASGGGGPSNISNPVATAPIPPSMITSTSTPGILLMDYHDAEENLHLLKDVRLRVFKRYNHWSYCVEEGSGHSRAWLPSWYIGKVGPSRGDKSHGSSRSGSGGSGSASKTANADGGSFGHSTSSQKTATIPLM